MAYIGDNYRRGNGAARYSPTFSRGGLGANFSCEVFDNDPGVTMTITIEHKNSEDVAFLPLGTIASMGLGVNSTNLTGIKEEVRLAFVVNGAVPNDTVYANVLAPQWRPY